MTKTAGNLDTWRCEWLTRWDEVWDPAFVAQWKHWMQESPTAHVFFEPCLVRAWYETYRELRRIEPRFLIARSGSERMVFFPLVYDRGGWKDAWQRAILPAGHCEFDYHDPILLCTAENNIWAGFWKALEVELSNQWRRTFELASSGRLRATVIPNDWPAVVVDHVPWIDLAHCQASHELLSGGRPSKLSQELHRKYRHLERLGAVALHVFARDDLNDAQASAGRFATAHARRWPEASTPTAFYTLVARHAVPAGLLHLSELRVGGETASWRFAYHHRSRFISHVAAYAPEFARQSPGKVHLWMVIDTAIRLGCTVFDFGRGREPYKMEWTDQAYPLYSVRWNRNGLRPWACCFWQEVLRPRAVRAKRWLVRRG